MYTIGKTFKFDAAHQLDHLPSDHKCSRLHGHTYQVTVTIVAEFPDDNSWVVDYGEMKSFKGWIDAHLDHKNLNDVLHFHTTAEMLARYLYDVANNTIDLPEGARIDSVRVQETQDTFAEYR